MSLDLLPLGELPKPAGYFARLWDSQDQFTRGVTGIHQDGSQPTTPTSCDFPARVPGVIGSSRFGAGRTGVHVPFRGLAG